MNSQFVYDSGDKFEFPRSSNEQMTALFAMLVKLECDHPGTLYHVLRLAALVNANFRIRSCVTDRERSIEAQQIVSDWISWYTENTNPEED